MAQWNEVANGVNDLNFDYNDAVLVRPHFAQGITGTLRLEQISGESVIPFFNGAITGTEIYVPPGKYNATVDLTAIKDGKTWAMQLSKPDSVEAVGQLVEIPFSADIKITDFAPNAGLREGEGGALYMYRGDTLRTKNELADINGNVIKNITDNYPVFAIYKITGDQKTLVYQQTTRYLSDACHWFSSSDYIGDTAPGIGTYLAELSFDLAPFSEKSTMGFQFELVDKDGTEKQGVNLRMDGSYHLPQAQMDIYVWENDGWIKSNTSPFTSNSSGYLEIPQNLSLSSQGSNLAVVRYTQRQLGYNYPETHLGYQVIPFSQLAELQTVDLPEGDAVRVNVYDKSGNRSSAALYLPIMSDAGGSLAKPYFVDHVKVDLGNAYYDGYTVNLLPGTYEYAFVSFQSVGEYYYLQQDQVSISAENSLTFEGSKSKMLTLDLPGGYSTYNLAPDAEKGSFVINAASATKFLLSPGVYDPTLIVNCGDTRLSIKAGQALDLTVENRTWNIDSSFTPRFTPASSVVPMNQSLNVNGSFKDKFDNRVTAAAKKQGLNYVPYLPKILMTGPDMQSVELAASYQSFMVPSSEFKTAGGYAFCFSYDFGQGVQQSENVTFMVQDGSAQITVGQDSRYTCAYGEAGEATLTMQDSVKGFNNITAQVTTAEAKRTVVFTHMRSGMVINQISLTRLFSASNNTANCGFNLQPGDLVVIEVK